MARTISHKRYNMSLSLCCSVILVFIVSDVRSLLTNSVRVRKLFSQQKSFSPSSSSFSFSSSFRLSVNARGKDVATPDSGKLKKKIDQPEVKKTIAELSEEKVKNEKLKHEKLTNEKVKNEKVKSDKVKVEKVKNEKEIPTDFIDGLPVKRIR
jgi:hypothetical protein